MARLLSSSPLLIVRYCHEKEVRKSITRFQHSLLCFSLTSALFCRILFHTVPLSLPRPALGMAIWHCHSIVFPVLLESLSVLVLIFYYFAFPPSFSCSLYSCAFCLCSCVHLFNILSLSCFEFSCSHLLFLFLVLCGLISPPRLSYIHTPSVDVHMLSYLMLLRCLPLNSLCSHLPF